MSKAKTVILREICYDVGLCSTPKTQVYIDDDATDYKLSTVINMYSQTHTIFKHTETSHCVPVTDQKVANTDARYTIISTYILMPK